jgi:hypothetical protein
MVDGFLVAVTIIIMLMLIGGDIWMMYHYLDDSEKGFSDSWL